MGFKDFPVAGKLACLVGAAVLGLTVFGTISYRSLSTLRVMGPVYDRIALGKDLVADILPPPVFILESWANVLEGVGTNEPGAADRIAARLKQLEEDFKVRHDFWEKNLTQSEMKTALTRDASAPVDEFFKIVKQEYIPALQAKDTAKASEIAFGKLQTAFDAHRDQIDKIVSLAAASNKNDEAFADSQTRSNTAMMIGTGIVAGVLTSLIGWIIARSVARPVNAMLATVSDLSDGDGDLTKRLTVNSRDEIGMLGDSFNQFLEKLHDTISVVVGSSSQVAAAATELRASAESSATQAGGQLERISSIAGAVSEMSGSADEVARKSADAANSAKKSGDAAASGGDVVRKTIDGVQLVRNTIAKGSKTVEDLGVQSQSIGVIIQTINDIADQTNLLALNAAIEAARAGEHGRGFAVVADEVRKLADRTTKATAEIASSIKSIQAETSRAVDQMEAGRNEADAGMHLAGEAGTKLEEIVAGAQEVAGMIQSIAAAAEEQSATSGHIAQTMEQLASVAREAEAGAREASQAVSMLSENAEQLNSTVARFKLRSRENSHSA
jgi:methyl-accepting chemotaxis protein